MFRLKKWMTFSNVVAMLALFFALGGSVYAASNKIDGSQITPKSLPGNRLQAQAVATAQIKNGAIGAPQLKANAVATKQLQPGAVTAGKIKAGTITANQLQAGAITGTQVKSGSLGATQINQTTLTGISAANIHTVQYVTSTVAIPPESESGTSATATCPSGMNVIGGGATVSRSSGGIINESAPTAGRNGWTAVGYAYGETGVNVTVTAICTPVATITG